MPEALLARAAAAALTATVTEYASVSLVLDHLAERDDGHTVLKHIFSTQTATESLMADLQYYGLLGVLTSPRLMRTVADASDVAAVFVLLVPEIGQHRAHTVVIADAAIYTELTAGGDPRNPEGTLLGATAALITLATDLKRTGQVQAPDDMVLVFLSNDEIDPA